MNSNVHYVYPGATPRSKMYKNYDFMKPLKYVLVWYMLLWCYVYDIIMWHRRMIHEGFMMQAVNDVVWCEHLVWIQYAACMYVVCMCLNDNVMSFFSVWCTRRMRRKSLYECCMKSYDVNMNVWRFREEMTEFREEMRSFPPVSLSHCR